MNAGIHKMVTVSLCWIFYFFFKLLKFLLDQVQFKNTAH